MKEKIYLEDMKISDREKLLPTFVQGYMLSQIRNNVKETKLK